MRVGDLDDALACGDAREGMNALMVRSPIILSVQHNEGDLVVLYIHCCE